MCPYSTVGRSGETERGIPDGTLQEHLREHDVAVEETRSVLVADAQYIAEALGGDEDRAVPFALQQGVGRHRGAHLDRLDSARRQRLALLQAEEAADALHGSILVLLGVLRQQLMGDQRAVGLARHDVSEGAAAAAPELTAGPTRKSTE